jgi:dienelactone hydrolase
MGLREHAECAGGFTPDPDPVTGAQRAAGGAGELLASALGYYRELATDEVDFAAIGDFYEAVKARKTLGALDAAAWMRSKANPLRDRLAGGKLGIAGHSLGAHGALLAGNGDPKERFGAVVSWDGFGSIAPTTAPRVPTLFFQHEIDRGLPKQRALVASRLPAYQDAERFRAARVPAGVVVPDGSTHQDFNFINYPVLWPVLATLFACPDCVPGANASRDGSRVALYYTQAWFDRELKGAPDDALRVRTFPASADASSIGQGTFDPVRFRNVPYTIGGEAVADKLSPLLPSFVPGCADLREGC